MSEAIENMGATRLDRSLEGGTYAVEIIQQIEWCAIQADKNVVSQCACVLAYSGVSSRHSLILSRSSTIVPAPCQCPLYVPFLSMMR